MDDTMKQWRRQPQTTNPNANVVDTQLVNRAVILQRLKGRYYNTVPSRLDDGEIFIRSFIPHMRLMTNVEARSRVFTTKMNPTVLQGFQTLIATQLKNKILRILPENIPMDGPDDRGSIVVKIVPPSPHLSGNRAQKNAEWKKYVWNDHLLRVMLEGEIHDYVLSRSPIEVMKGIRLDAHKIAPQLYFGGSTMDGGLYVLVMKRAPGKSLYDSIKHNHNVLDPLVAAHVEKTILTLVALGIEHGDSHDNNIYIDMSSKNQGAMFIDFGMSIRLPESIRHHALACIKKAIESLRNGSWSDTYIDEIFQGPGRVLEYADARMIRRRYTQFYYPSYSLLQYVRSRVDKQDLDLARRIVWNIASLSNTKPTRSLMNYSNI